MNEFTPLEIAIRLATAHHSDHYMREHIAPVYRLSLIRSMDIYPDTTYFRRFIAPALYLHDALEDTELSPEVIEAVLGRRVLDIVSKVTDGPEKTRKERKADMYRRCRGDLDATFVKLNDRLQNIQRGGKIDMYRKEHPDFEAALRQPETMPTLEPLWNEIAEALT